MSTYLGVNHQFLYPDSMTNENIHTETLKKLAQNDLVQALDCWTWRGETAKEEIKILKDSGKIINYNIGDRFGEKQAFPASSDNKERIRAYDLMMREISYGIEAGSKKIIFGSGPDIPDDHFGAIERFQELILKVLTQLPDDIQLALEPTDWNIDKFFLFGKVEETADFINSIKNSGFKNIGMLIDMCHIPIMHETLETALKKAGDTLIHIHLGNCVIKNKDNPFYGDRHIPWDYPGGEYSEEDGIKFIALLKDIGYFDKDNTVSFEMRPIEGLTSEESLERWVSLWNSTTK